MKERTCIYGLLILTAINGYGVSANSPSEYVEALLQAWPKEDVRRVRDTLNSEEVLRAIPVKLQTEYLRAVAEAHGSPAVLTTAGVVVVEATVEAAVGYHLHSGPGDLNAQYTEATALARACFEQWREWFPGGVPDAGLARFQAEIDAAQANPLNLGFQAALPASLHEEVMETWGEELDELAEPGESAFREKF